MFNSCIYIEVDDVLTVLSRTTPCAKKSHICCECRQIIHPSKKYERDVTIAPWDGFFKVYKTCEPCVNVRNSLLMGNFYYEGIWEIIHEEYCDENFCLCPKKEY